MLFEPKWLSITNAEMANRKNIEEIQELYLKGLTFHYVKDIKEVFAIALTDEKVADAIDLSVKKEKTEKKEE